MSNDMSISKSQAIEQVTAQLSGPIAFDEFVKRVLALWPSQAKKPAGSIRQSVKWEYTGKILIFLEKKTIAPLQTALQGVTFRIPLSRQEVKQGMLLVYPNFTFFLPDDVPPTEVQLLDATGQPLPTKIITRKQTKRGLLGSYTYEETAFDLSRWFKKRGVKRDDSLLVTIEDWQGRQFRLAHEPAKVRRRQREVIERRNRELADLIFEMLESERYERIVGREAILTAYARLSDPTGYPGDHWQEVIEQDRRMRWTGSDITYVENYSPLDRIMLGDEEPTVAEVAYSPEQGQQVYRFKAYLKHRKGLWRRIDIQGQQTLGNLDRMLRNAFEHDWDHMSGFWQLVRRGQGRRFREVDLGSLNPFGEGEAADVTIAGLGLEPGQELKYVYDFGDWIEHRITLESIGEPEEGIDYPRLVEKNKPRYRYCRHCQSEGRKTVATWICIECSNQEQEDVLICQDCHYACHEGHYGDEILY